MPKFSQTSLKNLEQVHPVLQAILNIAIQYMDFTVLDGFRSEEEQNRYYEEGTSKVRWPDSKHNKSPSHAVDVAPWPIDWSNEERFYYVCGFIMGVGELYLWSQGLSNQITLRYGGDWDRDSEVKDQTFMDLGHIELIIKGEDK